MNTPLQCPACGSNQINVRAARGSGPSLATCQDCGYSNYIGFFGGTKHLVRSHYGFLFPLEGTTPITGYVVTLDGVNIAMVARTPGGLRQFSLYRRNYPVVTYEQLRDVITAIYETHAQPGQARLAEFIFARLPEPIFGGGAIHRRGKWDGSPTEPVEPQETQIDSGTHTDVQA